MTPLGDGNRSPYLHGTNHTKPKPGGRYFECRSCGARLDRARKDLDWLCDLYLSKPPETRRDLRRTTLRSIR
jgi:hypothetical protein